MDLMTKLSYERGTLPDRFWYQLNGKSAQENYREIILKRQRALAEEEDELVVRCEVKVK